MKNVNEIFKSNIIFVITILSLSVILISCSSENSTTPDNPNNIFVIGEVSWKDWQKKTGWDSTLADSYNPDKQKSANLNQLVDSQNVTFLIFGGSWCPDTKSELPKVYKLLNSANISINKARLFGVGMNKQEPSGTAALNHVGKVCTVIVLKNGSEIGRIIENPQSGESWEDELLNIINKG